MARRSLQIILLCLVAFITCNVCLQQKQKISYNMHSDTDRPLADDAVDECPQECSCSWSQIQDCHSNFLLHTCKELIVHCRGSGENQLPAKFPVWTRKLYITNYSQVELTRDTFEDITLSLRELWLSGNNISILSTDVFHWFIELTVLALDHNTLERLPRDAFMWTVNLKILDLSYNQFKDTTFVSSAVCVNRVTYPKLAELHLRSCGLTQLDAHAFNSCHLTTLDLSDNNLVHIGPNELTGFDGQTTSRSGIVVFGKVFLNLSYNRIQTISRNCGLEEAMDVNRWIMLLLDGNRICCNDEMLWMRNYRSCIDRDQLCYPYSGNTLFTFKRSNHSEQCVGEVSKSSSSNAYYIRVVLLSVGVPVAVIVVIFLIIKVSSLVRSWIYCETVSPRAVEKKMVLESSPSYGSMEISDSLRSFVVPYTNLHFRRIIGVGGYGTVYRAKLHSCTVAVKVLKIEGVQAVKGFFKEAEVLSNLHHENIVRLLGVCTSPQYLCIVMEFVQRGSVKELLTRKNTAIDWLRKYSMLLDAVKGMVYLHSRWPPVIHRDLKCCNLLVGEDWRVKVCDFGVAKHLKQLSAVSPHTTSSGSSRGHSCAIGTVRFTAPELLRKGGKSKLTTKADVYSFGIILWQFAAASEVPPDDPRDLDLFYLCPFGHLSWSYQVADAVTSGERPLIPVSCPCPVQVLMQKCWQDTLTDRPAFTDILDSLHRATACAGFLMSSEMSDDN